MAPLAGTISEPEYTLKPGEVLSAAWRTTGRHVGPLEPSQTAPLPSFPWGGSHAALIPKP